ncbi:MAG: CinA family nicotinamide mononucleotide deamidase-related protein [Thermanaerothrix sp.]|nr:CinA family nicotinamide mononucleotide deamidase-related protein [Thermanaerothrix sp.]
MTNAEVIAIGTELLLGEIRDSNIQYLARILRSLGIDMYRATLVGDNITRIAEAVREAMQRADIVITSGGLGPTVDDPTREAIAMALGVPLELKPELWSQIEERYHRFGRQPGENARRQAYIPLGAIPIENPVGTAPGFICEINSRVIISLPGVPRELEYLMEAKVVPYLRERYGQQGIIKTLVLRTAGIPESQIDEWLADYERLSNPTVGLAAHPGTVDIRLTAKAATEAEADQMLENLAAQIRPLLGEALFGINEQSLSQTVVNLLAQKHWSLHVITCGFDISPLNDALTRGNPINLKIIHIQEPCTETQPSPEEEQSHFDNLANVFLIVSLQERGSIAELILKVRTPAHTVTDKRYFGGPPANRSIWATNTALDFLRRVLITHPTLIHTHTGEQ